MSGTSFDIHQVLRWLVVAIATMVAIIILGGILKIAGFLMQYVIKALFILLIAAIVLRVVAAFQGRSRH